jgi:putative endonuclease
MQGAQADVGQIADGCGYHIQRTGWVVLGSSSSMCRRQSRVKVGVHQGVTVNKPESQMLVQTHRQETTKQKGDAAEDRALQHLQDHGLKLLQRNYRTPGRGGGEIDLVMRDFDGTLVFIEVRRRRNAKHGGALGSITTSKQRRIVFAASCYLLKLHTTPPCRFDVVTVEADQLQWFKAAFDAW